MGRLTARLVVSAAMLASVLGVATPGAWAAESAAVVEFEGDAGAHPVDGRSGTWASPGYEVRFWEYENVVKADAASWDGWDWIRIEIGGPAGAPLEPGTYTGARHPSPGHDGPTIKVVAATRETGGLSCGDDRATVTVERVERDEYGTLTAFDADVEHRCGAESGPALRAHLHFTA
jgi:hypothetical protein